MRNGLAPRYIGKMTGQGYVRPYPQNRSFGVGDAGGSVIVGPNTANANYAAYQTAAQTLLSDLQSSGCQQTAQADVTTFQNAWNSAGGTPALTANGLYDTNTATALDNFDSSAPTGCVAAASTTTASGSTTPTVNVDASSSTDVVPIAIAGVAAAGLIGFAIYAQKTRGYVFRKPRRR